MEFLKLSIPGRVLPMKAYMGRHRPKGVPFSGFRKIKGFHKLRNIKDREIGHLGN